MLISTLAGWRSRELWENRKTHHDGTCEPVAVLLGDVDLDVDRDAFTIGMTEDSMHRVELRQIALVGLECWAICRLALFLQSNLICLTTAPLAARVRRDLKDDHPFMTNLKTLPYIITAVL